jgi:nucleoside-diphosphate-sugar epimerase
MEMGDTVTGSYKGVVFVTGGTGFLGAYIIKELVGKGYRVKALRRSTRLPFFIEPSVFGSVDWVDGDIQDPVSIGEAMSGALAVIHAAAKVSFQKRDRDEIFRTNIEGTTNLVNAALDNQVQRFIYISSVASLGRSAEGESVDEGRQWEPVRLHTNYARSKYQAEMEVWRGIAEGLPAAIVNPSTILGFGDWDNTSCAIFKNVYHQFPWYTNGINGFVDVEDTAKAVVLLLESPVVGERFILSGDNWSFRKLLDTIADGFSKKHPDKEATAFLAGMAWRFEKFKTAFTGTPSLLTRESARIASSRTYFDNRKILHYLPSFAFTPLELSIYRSCKAYLQMLEIE